MLPKGTPVEIIEGPYAGQQGKVHSYCGPTPKGTTPKNPAHFIIYPDDGGEEISIIRRNFKRLDRE